jgi:transcriptional regulatory protein LevR
MLLKLYGIHLVEATKRDKGLQDGFRCGKTVGTKWMVMFLSYLSKENIAIQHSVMELIKSRYESKLGNSVERNIFVRLICHCP